jgi:rhamnogalacturonan endolyase
MMKKLTLTFISALLSGSFVMAQTNNPDDRALWASINGASNASLADYQQHTNKVLVSWRMLPGDDAETGFDLYRRYGTGTERKIATNITNRTCYQDATVGKAADITYRLTYADSPDTLATYVLTKAQVSAGLPYISIPLADTKDVYENTSKIVYTANDVSVGDLDGDGQFEIVVKRLQSVLDESGNIVSDGSGASYSQQDCLWAVIWDAYKLDGTLLWRIKGGPGVILGNSSSFAVADFDGDGCAEMAIRTCEGTVFGDGTEIPDTNGDGKIDYRTWGNLTSSNPGYLDHYNSAGPEFLSIIDGRTGRELARDNYINRETSQSWGDNYWKRACSFRVGVGCFDEAGLPSVVIGRGVYAHSVIEAWDWRDGQLTKRWRFDTNDGGTGRDGKKHSTYASQGNHSLNVADLDGDGLDEVMYGSMAVDHDGIGLWNTGLGHGDANHVGKFLPEREGLQMFHCLETGKTMVALHDARDGSVIWKKVADSDNDMGRCLVGDFFPEYPGCEFFYYQGNYIRQDGTETGINTKGQKGGCGMAVWFDGSLSRQLIEDNIIQSPKYGRTFTMYRYSETFINGTKSNPSWYGDLFGDWREEIIVPDGTRLQDIKIFSTWYPTTHKFPWLMTDHCYWMSALNENIGYNQPTHTGYYLGSDLQTDADAWAEAAKVQNRQQETGIRDVLNDNRSAASQDGVIYDLFGRRVSGTYKGILIQNGKKVYNK